MTTNQVYAAVAGAVAGCTGLIMLTTLSDPTAPIWAKVVSVPVFLAGLWMGRYVYRKFRPWDNEEE